MLPVVQLVKNTDSVAYSFIQSAIEKLIVFNAFLRLSLMSCEGKNSYSIVRNKSVLRRVFSDLFLSQYATPSHLIVDRASSSHSK